MGNSLKLYAYRKLHDPKSKAYSDMLTNLNKYIAKGYDFKLWNGYHFVTDGNVVDNIREVDVYQDKKIVVVTFF
jgi:hypothetical protein